MRRCGLALLALLASVAAARADPFSLFKAAGLGQRMGRQEVPEKAPPEQRVEPAAGEAAAERATAATAAASSRAESAADKDDTKRRLLMGVAGKLKDVQLRILMRRTWIAEAKDVATSLTVRFILCRPETPDEAEAIRIENETHGDMLSFPCSDKTDRQKCFKIPLRFGWFSLTQADEQYKSFDYVGSMDTDVFVWPGELEEHMGGFPKESFYAGVPVNVYRRNYQPDRFVFCNGGFFLMSRDLAKVLAGHFAKASYDEEGCITGDRFDGNDDVIIGRMFKDRWTAGKLMVNVGKFPWSASAGNPPDVKDLSKRACPWRHAKELKFDTGYLRQWDTRNQTDCRCNCPDKMTFSEKEIYHNYRVGRNESRRMASNLYLWPEIALQTDGIGGHIQRGLLPLEIGLALDLQLVCNPLLFFNGHMKDTDPYRFGELVGCSNTSVRGEWVDVKAIESLPRQKVNWCNVGSMVRRHVQKGEGPMVFELEQPAVASRGHGMGAGAALWLRQQYHLLRQQRSHDHSQHWGEAKHRIAVHFRSTLWSLTPAMHKGKETASMGYFEHVSRMLKELESSHLPKGSLENGDVRIIVLGSMQEDERGQERVRAELERLRLAYPKAIRISAHDRNSSRAPSNLTDDLDILTTSDYLIVGKGQFGALAAMMQQSEGKHLLENGWYAGPRMPNSWFVAPGGHLPGETELDRRIPADAPMKRAQVMELKKKFPDAPCTAEERMARMDGGRRKKKEL